MVRPLLSKEVYPLQGHLAPVNHEAKARLSQDIKYVNARALELFPTPKPPLKTAFFRFQREIPSSM